MAKAMGIETLQVDFADSSSAATLADVSGLAFSAIVGKKYRFRFMLFVTASVTTRGGAFGLNASPTTAATFLSANGSVPTVTTEGTDSFYEYAINAFGDVAAAPAGLNATAGNIATIEGIIVPAATQLVFPQLRPEAVAGTITVEADLSHVEWREL